VISISKYTTLDDFSFRTAKLQTLPDDAVICPNHMHRPQAQNECRNSNCHDEPCPWAKQSTFDDSQEEKRKEERQELEEAPNRYPNPSRH
jgi:hypothetical protein